MSVTRRDFVITAGAAAAGAALTPALAQTPSRKIRYAVLGTGHRGTGMWGEQVLKAHGDRVEMVALCDRNPKRVEIAREMLGVACPTFTDFDRMLREARPELIAINYHGADYFRRWHRLRNQGGSLWVHKATHHFDLAAWWLDAEPVEVTARGSLERYGRKGAFRHTSCRGCPHAARCAFATDITGDERKVKLYVQAESADGYLRDGCVFREDADIYDTMSALITYSNGVTMSYSLNAFMPFEGHRVAFNCERGRLEVRHFDTQPWQKEESIEFHVTTSFGNRRDVPIAIEKSGHGGGDPRLLETIFARVERPPHLRLPDSRAGALSCLTGIAARRSCEERKTVRIAELMA